MMYSSTSLQADGCSCSALMNFLIIVVSSIPTRTFAALTSEASETLKAHHNRSRRLPVCIKCASGCR